jgi:hypothetical protein
LARKFGELGREALTKVFVVHEQVISIDAHLASQPLTTAEPKLAVVFQRIDKLVAILFGIKMQKLGIFILLEIANPCVAIHPCVVVFGKKKEKKCLL